MKAIRDRRGGVGRAPSPLHFTVLLAFLLLASPAAADLRLWAQADDPEEMFAELVLEEGYDADQARDAVADRYGPVLATEIAVYWCSPEPAAGCDGSEVLDAWLDFENLIYEGHSADVAMADLAQDDESLATALAVYWCSPEPGDGCDGSAVAEAWLRFDDLLTQGYPADQVLADLARLYGSGLSEGLAAYACGDLECAEGELDDAVADQPMPQADEPQAGAAKKNKYPKKRRGGRPGG